MNKPGIVWTVLFEAYAAETEVWGPTLEVPRGMAVYCDVDCDVIIFNYPVWADMFFVPFQPVISTSVTAIDDEWEPQHTAKAL